MEAKQAKRVQLEAWQAIDNDPATRLRQRWSDETWMRAHLRAAGVRVGSDLEPASVRRLRSKLSKAGITAPDVRDAIGLTLGEFLRANPRLPLWAALALVLESTGKFTPEASKPTDRVPEA